MTVPLKPEYFYFESDHNINARAFTVLKLTTPNNSSRCNKCKTAVHLQRTVKTCNTLRKITLRVTNNAFQALSKVDLQGNKLRQNQNSPT
jgi:hypothetical protein